MSLRIRLAAVVVLVASTFALTLSASADQHEHQYYPWATDEFEEVWERTDRPVLEDVVNRTWIWGPGANHPDLITEFYAEAEDQERLVQYGDKSRMEWPWSPEADPESPWFITQGLLATELMTGSLQLGEDTFQQHLPSNRPAAGDPDDVTGPTYLAMGMHIDRAPRAGGEVIVEVIDRDGVITENEAYAQYNVTDVAVPEAQQIEGIDKNIASVFWDHMQSETTIYLDGEYVQGDLYVNPFYAIGYPKTDAFWAEVKVRDVVTSVLVQCFERRCLTYQPDNPEGWEAESGNIGQHYYNWRYHEIGDPILPDLTLTLHHEDEVNDFGTDHTFTATLTENGTAVDFGIAAEFNVTVARDGVELEVIDGLDFDVEDNLATITYSGPASGTVEVVDTIDVSVMVNDTDVVGTPTLTKTWVFDSETCDDTVTSGGSIQDAIDDANPNEIICVEAGTYAQTVNIHVDGLTLLALDGPETTIIESDTTDQSGVVALNADGVTISGFTVDNQDAVDSRAIRFHDSVDDVTIENNILTDARRGVQGNWTDGGANITIVGNVFHTEFGVAGTENVNGLIITGNTFNTTEEGIGLGEGVANWVLETNHFAGAGNHVVDYRDTPVAAELEAIIDANTFEAEVEVVGNAIVNAE